jgi:purine nucleoside permease
VDFIGKAIDWIKLSPRYLFPIALLTGCLLCAPSWVLEILGLNWEMPAIRPYMGGIFALSSTLLLSAYLVKIGNWVSAKVTVLDQRIRAKARLHKLTDPEKEILGKFIDKPVRALPLDATDGHVCDLERLRIIRKASKYSRHGRGATIITDYCISEWAFKYLKKHRDLLSLD